MGDRVEVLRCGVVGGEVFVRGGRDVVSLHEVFAEGLATLHCCCGLAGPKGLDVRRMLGEVVDDAGDERRLGAGDDKVDVLLFGEADEPSEVGVLDCCDVCDFRGDGCGAAVAGADVDVLDSWRLEELPGDCVLAAAVADEEDSKLVSHCVCGVNNW